jgi:hypothetical protein
VPVTGQTEQDRAVLAGLAGRKRLVDGRRMAWLLSGAGRMPSVRANMTAASKQVFWCTATASIAFSFWSSDTSGESPW